MSIQSVAIIGLGLLGGSVGLAIQEHAGEIATKGYDRDANVRARAGDRDLVGEVCNTAADAVNGSDLVVLCVPVGAMEASAAEIEPHLAPGTIISDVGSSKESVAKALAKVLPGHTIIPAHPVAGTEQSGPDAGFASLFTNRWCILTPPQGADEKAIAELSEFWTKLGAKVDLMDAKHHDLVLCIH